VDMGGEWGRLGGLDLPSLNLIFNCKERDRRPVNEWSIMSLGGPCPVCRKDVGGNLFTELRSRESTSLLVQEKNLTRRISMSKD
jgi:hypothetical protein